MESSAPPPPPPEPTEAPPPPPGDEIPTALVAKPASLSRPMVDYSDLDMASASPPRATLPVAVPQSTETQLPALPQVREIYMKNDILCFLFVLLLCS